MITKRPTIADVARAAGVSTATVSRALNGGMVSAGAAARVQSAVRQLGYRRNALARGLVTGKTGVIGVLIPDVLGPLYAQMARGIEEVLSASGMHFIMATDNRDPKQERRAIELLLARNIDAVVLIGSRLDNAELERLLQGLPAVHIQREAPDHCPGHGAIGLDNFAGTKLALDHLCAMGHTSIAHVSGVRRDGAARADAYRRLMEARALSQVVVAGDSTEQAGFVAGERIAREGGVTAVFCTNDRTAVGLYHALKSHDVRVPNDVSVVGFDDLPWGAYLDPPLTTVRQPARDIGMAAASQLLDSVRLNSAPGVANIAPVLVLRASVAALGDRRRKKGGSRDKVVRQALCHKAAAK